MIEQVDHFEFTVGCSTLRSLFDFVHFQNHPPTLSYEELTAARRNLQTSGIDVDNEFIRQTWHPVYRRHFLRKSLSRAYDCRKGFYMYHQGLECEVRTHLCVSIQSVSLHDFFFQQLDCNDVVLFWRIQQMLKVTANALRQQIMNREGIYDFIQVSLTL